MIGFTDKNVLLERTTSSFPLSIGTGIAMESLFPPELPAYDEKREIPNYITATDYNTIWVNVATLFRNMIGSIPREKILDVSPMDAADTVISEIEVISRLFRDNTNEFCKPEFYFCDYHTQYKKQNHNAVRLRADNTPTQKHLNHLLMNTLKYIAKDHKELIHHLNDEIKPKLNNGSSLILTHTPFDLLSGSNFKRLDLIESHTGKLKSKHQWYTKYYNVGKEPMNTLPFQRKLLLIFGDSVMFHPMDMRFRKLILDISKERHWTPMTTESKVLLDLDVSIKERYLFEMFKIL